MRKMLSGESTEIGSYSPKLEDEDMEKVSSYLHEVDMDEGIEYTGRWTAALLTLAKY